MPTIAQQTGIDMAKARERTSIDVALVREFLHSNGPAFINYRLSSIIPLDGADKWNERNSIVSILENDPVFDKSKR